MVIRLNDYTHEQIMEAQASAKQLAPAYCATCGKRFIPKRKWQSFCSSRCRSKNHTTRLEENLTSLQVHCQTLEADKLELLREISELRKQLGRG